MANASAVNEVGFVEPDKCGKHENAKKKRLSYDIRQSVHQHTESFPHVELHYLQKDTVREYLEEGLSGPSNNVLHVHRMVSRERATTSQRMVV